MREYKETEIVGHQFTRCKGVQIINELGSPTKQILFHEENVAVMGNNSMTQPIGAVMNAMTADNAGTEFDLIDFSTMLPSGRKVTYQDAYDIMASLYLHTAMRRDAEEEQMNIQAEAQRQAEIQRQAEEDERMRLAQEAEAQAVEAQRLAEAEQVRQAAETARAIAAAEEAVKAAQAAQDKLEADQRAAAEAERVEREAQAEAQRQEWAAAKAAAAEAAAEAEPGATPAEGPGEAS